MTDTPDLETRRDTALSAFRARNELLTVSSINAFFSAANVELNNGAYAFLRAVYQHEDDETLSGLMNECIRQRQANPTTKLYYSLPYPG